MELILAVVVAGPIGYFTGARKRGLVMYLALWAIVFPIQTILVHSDNAGDIGVLYFVLNALILCLGIGLNRLGSVLGERRRSRQDVVASP
jgi:hypothetical protein